MRAASSSQSACGYIALHLWLGLLTIASGEQGHLRPSHFQQHGTTRSSTNSSEDRGWHVSSAPEFGCTRTKGTASASSAGSPSTSGQHRPPLRTKTTRSRNYERCGKLGITPGTPFAEQIRGTLLKRNEDAAAAAAASPQQSPQALVSEAAAKLSHAFKKRGQAEQALVKLGNEAEKLRDKLMEVLGKIGPADQQLQEAITLVEEADKYNQECNASIREPAPGTPSSTASHDRLQAARSRLEAANQEAAFATQALKEEQAAEDEAARKTKEAEEARAAGSGPAAGAAPEAPVAPVPVATAAPGGAGTLLVRLQQQMQQQQLQLMDGAPPAGAPTSAPDPIERVEDADMPQQLVLQSTAAKRAAESAGGSLKEAEAAIKKIKAVRGKSAPTSPRGTSPRG